LKRLCTPKSLPYTAILRRVIGHNCRGKRQWSGRPDFLSMRGKAIKTTDQDPRAGD
jgi:hypothetical protein